ncbi:MAG: hypothetical protein AB1489_22955 [Acidobacteriota bacterium]
MSKVVIDFKPMTIVKNIVDEYDAIVKAQHKFEITLTSAALNRERKWLEQLKIELLNLSKVLRDHCLMAEQAGGLLIEIQEKMLAVNKHLVDTREYHRRLLLTCDSLLAEIERQLNSKTITVGDLRRRAISLLSELQHHQACEADLVFEAFERDIAAFD